MALFSPKTGQKDAVPASGTPGFSSPDVDVLRKTVIESPDYPEQSRLATWKTLSRFIASVCDVGAGRTVDLGVQAPSQLPAQDGLKVVCDLLQQSHQGALQLAARNPTYLERLCAATVEELSRHNDEPTF